MARPDDDDEIAKSKRPQVFPRDLYGMGTEQMRDYIAELQAEISKVEAQIAKQGGMKSAAEALFGKKPS